MPKVENGIQRSKGMRVFVSILYAWLVAGVGMYVWFVCQQASGLLLIWSDVGRGYKFFQMVAVIVYGLIFMLTVTWGQHAFEKAIVERNQWLPRSFILIIGIEAIVWIAARIIIYVYGV